MRRRPGRIDHGAMRQRITWLVALAGAIAPAGTAQADIWTPVESGTTATITAVEYQGPDRIWFATADGGLFRRENGTFVDRAPASAAGASFNDIEFRGDVGFAVGNADQIYRTMNAGASWTRIGPGSVPRAQNNCPGTTTTALDVYSVRFAGPSTVYITGQGNLVSRSTNLSTFVDVNTRAGGGCKVGAPEISDTWWLPSNPQTGYLAVGGTAGTYEGLLFRTTDGLTSSAQQRSYLRCCRSRPTRLAGDPENPERGWSTSDLKRTEDGWTTHEEFTRPQPGSPTASGAWRDIAYRDGTLIAVREAGRIATSIDGRSLYYQPAAGELATRDWLAVSLADGRRGVIAGVGGALAFSDRLDTVPDIVAPTGRITGPDQIVAGESVTFAAEVEDTGGSGIDPETVNWFRDGSNDRFGSTFEFRGDPGRTSTTLRIVFTDNAGNRGEATKIVRIVPPSPPPPPPLPPQATFRFAGGGLPAPVVRRRNATLRVRGTLVVPAGACQGVVTVTLTSGSRRLARRTARVAPDCRFSTTVRFATRRVRRGRITARLSFAGNALAGAGTYTQQIRLRRR